MAGRPVKEFEKYLTDGSTCHVGHGEYISSPATAFLRHLVEAKTAIDLCVRTLPKKNNGDFTKASEDTLQYLLVATLPSIMGHFETYQRYLFSGMFDLSVHLDGFDVTNFFKILENETSINLNWNRLAAHRALGASSVGSLLADSIGSWHNPDKVNNYFSCFKLKFIPFGNDDKKRLKTLWQLRHSIAHTGGSLTLADAQKVETLAGFGGRNISFETNFIFEVARKFHPLIKNATEGLGSKFKSQLVNNISLEAKNRVDDFFAVKSSIPVWLK